MFHILELVVQEHLLELGHQHLLLWQYQHPLLHGNFYVALYRKLNFLKPQKQERLCIPFHFQSDPS